MTYDADDAAILMATQKNKGRALLYMLARLPVFKIDLHIRACVVNVRRGTI